MGGRKGEAAHCVIIIGVTTNFLSQRRDLTTHKYKHKNYILVPQTFSHVLGLKRHEIAHCMINFCVFGDLRNSRTHTIMSTQRKKHISYDDCIYIGYIHVYLY